MIFAVDSNIVNSAVNHQAKNYKFCPERYMMITAAV